VSTSERRLELSGQELIELAHFMYVLAHRRFIGCHVARLSLRYGFITTLVSKV
jgi:hypothetical protein